MCQKVAAPRGHRNEMLARIEARVEIDGSSSDGTQFLGRCMDNLGLAVDCEITELCWESNQPILEP